MVEKIVEDGSIGLRVVVPNLIGIILREDNCVGEMGEEVIERRIEVGINLGIRKVSIGVGIERRNGRWEKAKERLWSKVFKNKQKRKDNSI